MEDLENDNAAGGGPGPGPAPTDPTAPTATAAAPIAATAITDPTDAPTTTAITAPTAITDPTATTATDAPTADKLGVGLGAGLAALAASAAALPSNSGDTVAALPTVTELSNSGAPAALQKPSVAGGTPSKIFGGVFANESELALVVVGMEISNSKLKDIIYSISSGIDFKKSDIRKIYRIVHSFGGYIGILDNHKAEWNGNKDASNENEKKGVSRRFKEQFDKFYKDYKNQDITQSGLVETLVEIARNKSITPDKDDKTIKEFIANVEKLMKCSETILRRPVRNEPPKEKPVDKKSEKKCIGISMGGKTKSRSHKRTIRCKTSKKRGTRRQK